MVAHETSARAGRTWAFGELPVWEQVLTVCSSGTSLHCPIGLPLPGFRASTYILHL